MRSRTLPRFWESYAALPLDVQRAARKSFLRWRENPFHPALHFKCIHQSERIWSVRVTRSYRALGLLEHDEVTWFWIGSHEDYERQY